MLPVAMAESQPEYLTTYTLDDAGNVTQAMGQGYGYGTYGVDFSLS
jgi:Na+/H+-translocating membrane pyrophosphatase